jgi:hypothetical protein
MNNSTKKHKSQWYEDYSKIGLLKASRTKKLPWRGVFLVRLAGISFASRRAVARLGLGTASGFFLLKKDPPASDS